MCYLLHNSLDWVDEYLWVKYKKTSTNVILCHENKNEMMSFIIFCKYILLKRPKYFML